MRISPSRTRQYSLSTNALPPSLSLFKCERLFHLGCLTPPLAEIPLGEWFCDDCLSHGAADYLSQPAVYKETPAPGTPGGEGGGPKRGRGRPRKFPDQQSQIMFMSEGAATPVGGEYVGGYASGPMELGTPIAGEKRERSPDYDDDDGSDYDGMFLERPWFIR